MQLLKIFLFISFIFCLQIKSLDALLYYLTVKDASLYLKALKYVFKLKEKNQDNNKIQKLLLDKNKLSMLAIEGQSTKVQRLSFSVFDPAIRCYVENYPKAKNVYIFSGSGFKFYLRVPDNLFENKKVQNFLRLSNKYKRKFLGKICYPAEFQDSNIVRSESLSWKRYFIWKSLGAAYLHQILFKDNSTNKLDKLDKVTICLVLSDGIVPPEIDSTRELTKEDYLNLFDELYFDSSENIGS